MNEQLLPLLRARPGQIAKRALVVGDPDRAATAAKLLDDVQEVGRFREYLTFTGHHRDLPITICSHGVGGSGAAVAFHELFLAGVHTVIRAGTCGALQPGIADGTIVVGTGAVRNDGISQTLIPPEYPAVAHYEVVSNLLNACATHGLQDAPTGIVLTAANFYPGLLDSQMDLWIKAQVVAVEMEFATLLTMAGLRGLRAGGLFVTDGNLAENESDAEIEDFAYNPHRDVVDEGKAKMLVIALDALSRL
ncbi:MAG: purine-nucleoside phosphorylase [Chloroflexi bacterium]|jgi:uridine phosphorylase|nr:purine-nucleoside phosphorylase [Chloroflexota bacterium]